MTDLSLREEWADDISRWLGISEDVLLAEDDWKVEILANGMSNIIFGPDFPDEILEPRGGVRSYRPVRSPF